jgi:phage terminase large subunit-like protein
MDEYAFMRPEVWEKIIRPQLARSEGGALFIGTPDGKNHFYDIWLQGKRTDDPKWGDWKSWHFPSIDNPHLPVDEIENARETMSKDVFAQEFLADFESSGGMVLMPKWFKTLSELPGPGDKYIAIDLAGFEKVDDGRTMSRRDEHAICVVHNHQFGWCIENIIHGQWDTRETALRIVKAFRDYRPLKIGIEKGMAKNAVMPYLEDEMSRLNIFFNVEELTHGNQRKTDRIAWAMQGRAEKGRIQLLDDARLNDKWISQFLQQCSDFPNQIAHDDLIDATSYIDQLADPWYDGPSMEEYWQPLDAISAY